MKNEISFDAISNDILKNRKFQMISNERHHGITRMDHTLRVASYVYKISKKLNLDYKSATRAALLHDFFVDSEYGDTKGLQKGLVHPEIALKNARKEFKVNEVEANAIVAHMFPLSKSVPKYKESWILTLVDKSVAIYECLSYKFSYVNVSNTLRTNVNFLSIFFFYLITMGRR